MCRVPTGNFRRPGKRKKESQGKHWTNARSAKVGRDMSAGFGNLKKTKRLICQLKPEKFSDQDWKFLGSGNKKITIPEMRVGESAKSMRKKRSCLKCGLGAQSQFYFLVFGLAGS